MALAAVAAHAQAMRSLPLLLTVLLACGNAAAPSSPGDDSGVADTGAAGDDTGSAPADAAIDYPPGPYGTSVGSVLGDVALAGFFREETTGLATEVPFDTSFSIGVLRAKAKARYALIHTGGYT